MIIINEHQAKMIDNLILRKQTKRSRSPKCPPSITFDALCLQCEYKFTNNEIVNLIPQLGNVSNLAFNVSKLRPHLYEIVNKIKDVDSRFNFEVYNNYLISTIRQRSINIIREKYKQLKNNK